MPRATVRAKVKIGTVNDNTDINDDKVQETVWVHAVYDPDPSSENHLWSKWTPALNLTMIISNPGAFGKLEAGKEYYLDFVPVEESANPTGRRAEDKI